MSISLKIKKKDLWLLSAIMVFLIGVGYVVAYNSGAAPSVMGHDASEIFTCPTAFTKIGNNGYVLGCMQNTERGGAAQYTAAEDCFDNYGGRLPFFIESKLAFDNYNLIDENDDDEWISDTEGSPDTGIVLQWDTVRGKWSGNYRDNDLVIQYRCWIPF